MTKSNTAVYFIDNVHSSFVINDIKEFAKRFNKIILFSVDQINEELIFPKNVVVYQNYLNWTELNIKRVLMQNLAGIIPIYINECYKVGEFLPLKKSLALLASNIYKAETIGAILKKDKHELKNAFFYSFWFYDCIFLAWLIKKKVSNRAYSRAHGGDLFEERLTLKGKVLFRHFQLKNLDGIYSISGIGKKYLQLKYPKYANKIKVAYLGTYAENLRGDINNLPKGTALNLLSCGNIVNGKRVYLIADALFECNTPVNWTHFGKYYEDDKSAHFSSSVARLKTKSNIRVNIKGSVSHDEVIGFYKSNQVDLFISLSEAEGIPVTMMEACSFGVPILSTDVGGCKEIVNEQTGILVDENIGSKALADILDNFTGSEKNTPEFKKGVRRFWEDKFDIKKNYDLFCKSISLHPA